MTEVDVGWAGEFEIRGTDAAGNRVRDRDESAQVLVVDMPRDANPVAFMDRGGRHGLPFTVAQEAVGAFDLEVDR